MKKLRQEKENGKIYNCKKILSLLFLLIGFLCVLQVFVANRTIDVSIRLAKLEERASDLARENRKLEREISKYTSLEIIEEKAKGMGMKKNPSYVFLTAPDKIAKK